MTLNVYDADVHHVGLNGKGYMVVGGYSKDSQREVGGAAEYGGQNDLIGQGPGLSRWTQDDWTGGAFQYRLEKDAAMFADSVGVIPAQQSRSLITVPPLYFKKAFNPAAQANPAGRSNLATPLSMFTIAGSIYVLFPHGLLRYRQDTNATSWGDAAIDANTYYVAAGYDLNEQVIYIACDSLVAGDRPFLQRVSPTTLAQLGTQGIYQGTLTRTANKTWKGMQIQDAHIVCGIGLRLYTAAPPEDTSDATLNATWTHIGRLPGIWKDSVAYNGMTYILCGTADGRTSLVAFDGTAVLPICDFPFNFRGECLYVYGGRVYAGGSGTDISGNARYAELHEVTGSSVRLVRTFAPESYQSRVTYPTTIKALIVDEGLLWFSEKGVRMIAYDLTSDGFFGASQFQQTALAIDAAVVGRERLWGWGQHDSDTTKHGLYRVAISGDTVSNYTARVITSDFIAEPAVDKRWSQAVIQTRYAAAGLDYSVDGGANWIALSVVSAAAGDLYTNVVDLTTIGACKHVRFRINLARLGVVTSFTELVAFTASFTFLSNGKHGWIFSLNGAEMIEGRDGTNVAQNVQEVADAIWSLRDQQTTFVDVDQEVYTVVVQHVTEQQPIIGPNVGGGQRPEAYFAVTLVEV